MSAGAPGGESLRESSNRPPVSAAVERGPLAHPAGIAVAGMSPYSARAEHGLAKSRLPKLRPRQPARSYRGPAAIAPNCHTGTRLSAPAEADRSGEEAQGSLAALLPGAEDQSLPLAERTRRLRESR